MTRRFDTRTFVGRNIVFDHLKDVTEHRHRRPYACERYHVIASGSR